LPTVFSALRMDTDAGSGFLKKSFVEKNLQQDPGSCRTEFAV
jgi:hypothetical protein